jgi:hypothetical protein
MFFGIDDIARTFDAISGDSAITFNAVRNPLTEWYMPCGFTDRYWTLGSTYTPSIDVVNLGPLVEGTTGIFTSNNPAVVPSGIWTYDDSSDYGDTVRLTGEDVFLPSDAIDLWGAGLSGTLDFGEDNGGPVDTIIIGMSAETLPRQLSSSPCMASYGSYWLISDDDSVHCYNGLQRMWSKKMDSTVVCFAIGDIAGPQNDNLEVVIVTKSLTGNRIHVGSILNGVVYEPWARQPYATTTASPEVMLVQPEGTFQQYILWFHDDLLCIEDAERGPLPDYSRQTLLAPFEVENYSFLNDGFFGDRLFITAGNLLAIIDLGCSRVYPPASELIPGYEYTFGPSVTGDFDGNGYAEVRFLTGDEESWHSYGTWSYDFWQDTAIVSFEGISEYSIPSDGIMALDPPIGGTEATTPMVMSTSDGTLIAHDGFGYSGYSYSSVLDHHYLASFDPVGSGVRCIVDANGGQVDMYRSSGGSLIEGNLSTVYQLLPGRVVDGYPTAFYDPVAFTCKLAITWHDTVSGDRGIDLCNTFGSSPPIWSGPHGRADNQRRSIYLLPIPTDDDHINITVRIRPCSAEFDSVRIEYSMFGYYGQTVDYYIVQWDHEADGEFPNALATIPITEGLGRNGVWVGLAPVTSYGNGYHRTYQPMFFRLQAYFR